jgi:hypothetical protein
MVCAVRQIQAKQVDVLVTNEGTIWMFTPLTDEAKEWVKENVPTESWQWMGNSFCCEHRYAPDLVEGMRGAGLVVRPQ